MRADDVRQVFGDYHNLLRWLTGFLTQEGEMADACIVDACTVADTQAPEFHEWLIHWAARATVARALQGERPRLAALAPKYEQNEPAHRSHPALSPAQLLLLVNNSEEIGARLDVLCRFVLIVCGIANNSCDEVASQLGISPSAVQGAYCVAFDTLEALASVVPQCVADNVSCCKA